MITSSQGTKHRRNEKRQHRTRETQNTKENTDKEKILRTKRRTKMRKTMMMGLATVMMIGALVGGATVAHADTLDQTSTSSNTSITKDEDGNTIETTVITKTVDGETTTSTIEELTDAKTGEKYLMHVPMDLANNSDVSVKEFYITPSYADEWGNNHLVNGSLQSGEAVEGMNISVNEAGSKFDFRFITDDGESYSIKDVEMSDISKDRVTLSFEGNAKDGYRLYHTTDETSETENS